MTRAARVVEDVRLAVSPANQSEDAVVSTVVSTVVNTVASTVVKGAETARVVAGVVVARVARAASLARNARSAVKKKSNAKCDAVNQKSVAHAEK